MKTLFRDNIVEALIGFGVIVVAVGFVVFAYGRTQAGPLSDGYVLKARFSNVAGISPGTDVRVAGIKVGAVAAQAIDPKAFQAVVTMTVDNSVVMPIDSSASITSEGLLGGNYIALTPGGETAMLKPGEEITETSGSTDLMGLIGSYINRTGASDATAPPAATPPAASPPAAGSPAASPPSAAPPR